MLVSGNEFKGAIMNTERIIEKVKKLLALASDPSAAPNEAATASRQAASLMAKYNLDLASLNQAELEAEWDISTAMMEGIRPGKKNAREVPTWIGIMAYGVKLYTRTRCSQSGCYIIFRGPRQDTELATWMLKALIDLAYSQSRQSADPTGFRNGFARAIQHRLKDMARDREEADAEAGSTALVVVDKLKAKMNELFGEEGDPSKTRTRSSSEGYSAGQRAHIPTARPVSSSSRRLLT